MRRPGQSVMPSPELPVMPRPELPVMPRPTQRMLRVRALPQVVLALALVAANSGVASAESLAPTTVIGEPDAKGAPVATRVTVRLFLDLECPFSRQAWPVYRDAIRAAPAAELLVHHLPLSRHRLAAAAATAAVAARQQGKELAFVDALLREPVPDPAAIARAAAAAGLDGDAMARFVQKPDAAAQVERERQAGLAFGIQATPSALLNGRGIPGSPPPEALARALQVAARAAAVLQAEAGANADVERIGILRGAPEFLPAFDALRGGRAVAGASAPAAPSGRLGDRYRVRLLDTDLQAGRRDAAVTAVLLLDPTSAWQMGQLRDLMALQARHDLRIVARMLPRLDGRGRVVRGRTSALDVSLLLAALVQGWPDLAPGLLVAVAKSPVLASAADVETLAAGLGGPAVTAGQGFGRPGSATAMPAIAADVLRKAADAPPATVAVQQAVESAERLEAQPGALFLNGRRWFGHVGDAGLAVGLTSLAAESRQMAAAQRLAPADVYARLVETGRWRSDAEMDLQPPESMGDDALLPDMGMAGVPVHLFVDFASPHSRAAFYMVRRLVDSADLPIRLRMVSIASSAEPCVTPSGAGFIVAHKMGKGMAFAERLFDARDPNTWQTIFGIAKRLRLRVGDFQVGVDAASTRTVAVATARIKTRLDMTDEPVLYIGGRLYTGPLDEGRIERAIRFVQGQRDKDESKHPSPKAK